MVGPITGTSGDDSLSGTENDDVFDLTLGGSDNARGKAGDDTFDMGASLDATDAIRAGDGADSVQLDGEYHLVFGATTISRVEQLELAGGHNYFLRMDDGNVAGGHFLSVNGSSLGAGETLTFNGKAETSGSFDIHGGAGNDILAGGSGHDYFQGNDGSNTISGGGGDDYIDSQTGTGADTIDGGSGEDFAYIYRAFASANLTFDFAGPNNTTKLIGDGTRMTGVESFRIIGGSGDDHFTGGAGDDTLGGNTGTNTLDGGAGNDNLSVGQGTGNTLKGGSGDDYISVNETTSDAIDGGQGLDVVHIDRSSSGAGLTFHFTDASAVTTLVGDGTTVTGVEAFEILSGSGNDDWQTGAGDDDLNGGSGDDTLNGGGGADSISGEDGTNILLGGAGDDDISTAGTADTVNGGAGNDFLNLDHSSSVADLTFEVTDPSAYTMLVGEGTTVKNVEAFSISGGSGADTFTMFGNGDDSLYGGDGNNHLSGAGGDDYLRAGTGDDVFNGGAGEDRVDFGNSGTAVDVNLVTGVATGQGNDMLVHIEDISGTDGNDRIIGDDADNHIYGGNGGTDTLKGGGGDDYIESYYNNGGTIDGGAGNDFAYLYRGNTNGNLTFVMGASNQVSTVVGEGTTLIRVEAVNLIGGGGDDNFTGGAGNDTFEGGSGTNVLNGGGGDDILIHDEDSSDAMDGGTGNDTAYISGPDDTDLTFHVVSAAAVTTLVGGNVTVQNVENFVFEGENGDDSIITIGGKDDLDGGDGNDFLSSGGGHDILEGGGGIDTLNGGGGRDTFRYEDVRDSTGALYDTIVGFNAAQDSISLSGELRSDEKVEGVNKAIGTGALNLASFDTDLAAAVNGKHLDGHFAVLFTADSGSLAGETFLVVDGNGRAGYQAGADYVIHLDGAANLGDFSVANFLYEERSVG